MAELYDVAVLGAGPGGCTAALYAARAACAPLCWSSFRSGARWPTRR